MLTLSHAAHLTAVAAEGFVRDFRFRAHAVAREHVPTALQVVANHYRPLSVADHHLSFFESDGWHLSDRLWALVSRVLRHAHDTI